MLCSAVLREGKAARAAAVKDFDIHVFIFQEGKEKSTSSKEKATEPDFWQILDPF